MTDPAPMTRERFAELTLIVVRRRFSQVEAFELFTELLRCRPELSANYAEESIEPRLDMEYGGGAKQLIGQDAEREAEMRHQSKGGK